MLTLESLREFGADVDSGLRRCMNMPNFYLGLFRHLQGDTRAEELQAALQAHDLDKAFGIAHDLKGAYGNLALTPLCNPVNEMTELLRVRTDTDYTALMNEILAQKKKLDALL